MAEKDNANPIVYSQSSSANQRLTSAAQAEWWRDTAIHSSATSGAGKANGSLSFNTNDTLLHDDDQDDNDQDTASPNAAAVPVSAEDEKIDSQEVYGTFILGVVRCGKDR